MYALDLRNHGLSPHAETMSYGAMAGDVCAWMDAQGVGPAELIGHSMGGKVAMLLACREPGAGQPARRRGHRAQGIPVGRPTAPSSRR